MEKSRKVKKLNMATDKSEQEGMLTNNSNVHLPKLAGESETDFVKHFLTKNNKPYVQPKQPRSNSGGAGPFQAPARGASLDVAGGTPSLQGVHEMRAKILQESIRQQQLQIKSMTEM